MNIALFGSTGLVGNEVRKLINTKHPTDKLALIVRKKLKDLSSQETEIISDLTSHEALKNKLLHFAPDMALCCLGTTIKKAGSKEAFYHVDHDLIFNSAKAAYLAGAKSFGVISSSGADNKSPFFYLKVKGQIEKDLISLGFSRLVILRPGLLLGHRSEQRPLEALSMKLAPFYDKLMIGPLKKYRPVEASTVAASLVSLAGSKGERVKILEGQDIVL